MTTHADVLLAALPTGAYEKASGTLIEKDVKAHAKALANAQTDADRLLATLSGIPPELLREYEQDYGLPRACALTAPSTQAERLAAIEAVALPVYHYRTQGVIDLFASFGETITHIQTYRPIQCIAPCNAATDTERSRFKLTISVQSPVTANLDCLIEHYLPIAWRVDIVEV